MTEHLKFGTTIDFVPPIESVQLGIRCEKLGFDSLWAVDHLIDTGGSKVEPWTTICAIGVQTQKIHFATAVTDTQRMHPARTAQTVATLSEITGGRVSLGIGAGEAMNIIPFGLPFDVPKVRAERLAEAIQVIRLLWGSDRKNPISFQGKHFHLSNAWLDVKTKFSPKIVVGALGGMNGLRVAGEYGDGWIPWINTAETYAKRLKIVEGFRSAKNIQNREFEPVAWIFLSLAESGAQLREAISNTKKALLAEIHTLKFIGFKPPEELIPYQQMLVSDSADQLINNAENSIPDELALQFLVSGSPSQIIEKIEAYRRAGAKQVVIEFQERGNEPLDKFAKSILPQFKTS
ncbi:MAG TPA: LLM class flavin-dependent oxidoreductase [Nitrososphaerales archaeon]|nr:LLM class flavin-dependent oxidoreductase [Nitrososphaerales archaeon]